MGGVGSYPLACWLGALGADLEAAAVCTGVVAVQCTQHSESPVFALHPHPGAVADPPKADQTWRGPGALLFLLLSSPGHSRLSLCSSL